MFNHIKVSGNPAGSNYTELPTNTNNLSKLDVSIQNLYLMNTTDLDAEFDQILSIEDKKIREVRILKFAEDHMNSNNWQKIYREYTKTNYFGNDLRPFFIRLAETYLRNGDRESTLKLHLPQFDLQIAELYLAEGNREKALEAIRNTLGKNAEKEEFLVKLAEACLEVQDIEIAFKTYRFLKQIQLKYPELQALANKFAESFLRNEDLKNTQRAMNEMCESGTKLKLSFKIVEYYLKKGIRDLALKAFEDSKCRVRYGYETHIDEKDFFCLMQFYYNHTDLITPRKLIENVVFQLASENIKHEFPGFLCDIRLNKFLNLLVDICIKKVEDCFPEKYDEERLAWLLNKLTYKTKEETFLEKIYEFIKKTEPKEPPKTAANPPHKYREVLEVLELPENASLEDIKKKYRELAKLYHPDKNPKGAQEDVIDFEIRMKGCRDKFAAISNAYNTLITAAEYKEDWEDLY